MTDRIYRDGLIYQSGSTLMHIAAFNDCYLFDISISGIAADISTFTIFAKKIQWLL